MIGRITVKRVLKRTAGWAAVLAQPLAGRCPRRAACIFCYHRVAEIGFVDPHVDDWNVHPARFEQHIAALATFAEFVPLLDLPTRLATAAACEKPLVCLTFDDGYASVCSRALPILERYQAPATVFVVTSVVGQWEPMPFDRWSQRHRDKAPPEAWRAMGWGELERCVASGLVTLGAHSHHHLQGQNCTPEQLAEEAARSRAVLIQRFGETQARAYAYPYGCTRLGQVKPDYVRAVQSAGYRLAVTTDLGLASPASDPYLLPRVEAHAVDGPWVLRAKAGGTLAPYQLTERFRKAKRFA
jgi:peptidoglycan/xylan/chitin deacetylase (PgdA/CDA1 family)